MKLNNALTEAVKYCIRADILTDFMKTKGSEVVNMLMTEFNVDDAKMVWREEGKEECERIKARQTVLRVLELRFKKIAPSIRKSVESLWI
jgi:hypothetical protein